MTRMEGVSNRLARRGDRLPKSVNLKKANKPLMEKRRRARINKSLDELKTMLMGSMKRMLPAHSKWEKADILEMSVQYVRTLRGQVSRENDSVACAQFISGFMNCINQIQKYAMMETDPGLKERYHPLIEQLLSHLKRFSNDCTADLSVTPAESPPSNSLSSVDEALSSSPEVVTSLRKLQMASSLVGKDGGSRVNGSPQGAMDGGSLWRPW